MIENSLNSPREVEAAEKIYALAMKFFLSNPDVMMGIGLLLRARVLPGGSCVDCCCGAGAAYLEASKSGEFQGNQLSECRGRSSLSNVGRQLICSNGWTTDNHFYNAFDGRCQEVRDKLDDGARTRCLEDSAMKRAAIRLVDDLTALGVKIFNQK